MGNLQTNLDKTYDSIPCKDPSSAKAIVAAIKDAEDKVSINKSHLSKTKYNYFFINLIVSNQPG
jgi:hypothetical protein